MYYVYSLQCLHTVLNLIIIPTTSCSSYRRKWGDREIKISIDSGLYILTSNDSVTIFD